MVKDLRLKLVIWSFFSSWAGVRWVLLLFKSDFLAKLTFPIFFKFYSFWKRTFTRGRCIWDLLQLRCFWRQKRFFCYFFILISLLNLLSLLRRTLCDFLLEFDNLLIELLVLFPLEVIFLCCDNSLLRVCFFLAPFESNLLKLLGWFIRGMSIVTNQSKVFIFVCLKSLAWLLWYSLRFRRRSHLFRKNASFDNNLLICLGCVHRRIGLLTGFLSTCLTHQGDLIL
jgi:hypothetical protein